MQGIHKLLLRWRLANVVHKLCKGAQWCSDENQFLRWCSRSFRAIKQMYAACCQSSTILCSRRKQKDSNNLLPILVPNTCVDAGPATGHWAIGHPALDWVPPDLRHSARAVSRPYPLRWWLHFPCRRPSCGERTTSVPTSR